MCRSPVSLRYLAGILIAAVPSATYASVLGRAGLFYLGVDHHEAELSFAGRVELASPGTPTDHQVADAVRAQVRLLDGPMLNGANPEMSLRSAHSIKHLEVAAAPDRPGIFVARYDFEGVVLTSSPLEQVQVTLAARPDLLYDRSAALTPPGKPNPCTHEEYSGADQFWHFWSPYREGCKLIEGRDYLKVPGTLSARDNTARTRPEYERLVNAQGIIPITVFFGLAHHSKDGNPYGSIDESAGNYRAIAAHLLEQGFKRTTPEVSESAPLPYLLEEFEKARDGALAGIRIRLFFGNTKFQDAESVTYHKLLKPAVEQDAVVVYSGHSGVGNNFNLDYLERAAHMSFHVDPSLYQIYMLEACNSTVYYADPLFRRKANRDDTQGTHNLDIIGNGLESDYADGYLRIRSLLDAIHAWASTGKLTTYSQILGGFPGDSFAGVSGDEDNPIVPSDW